MAYGLKYMAEYDTLGQTAQRCRIEIYEKNYSGIVYPLNLSAEPVIQKYEKDDPFAPIKGCALTLNFHNTGVLPLTNFYSPEDDQFKVIHYLAGTPTFVGFIVQEDSSEDMVDYRHTVSISANDNLGLLKNVPLNQTPINTYRVFEPVLIARGAPDGLIISENVYVPEVGVPFNIYGTSFDGLYTPTAVAAGSGFYTVTVAESVTTGSGVAGYLAVQESMNFYGFNNLLSIIQACLANTSLELETVVFANIFEDSNDTGNSFLQQTFINTQTFLNETSFDNCWNVLEIILKRFGLTLYQQGGRWVIIRNREFRYGVINGFIYDNTFRLIGTETAGASDIQLGFNQTYYPISAPQQSFIRPYKYTKQTFNYEQPKYLLKNYDLHEIGALITQYTTGSGINLKTIKEYAAISWQPIPNPIGPSTFIRVIYDNEGNEIDRYLVQRGPTLDSALSINGVPFEVGINDRIRLDFTMVSNVSQAGPGNIQIAIALTDGTTTLFADERAGVGWIAGQRWAYSLGSFDNINNTQSVSIITNAVPFAGLIYVYLPHIPPTPISLTDETRIKDIRLTYIPSINNSTKVIGHIHTNEQPLNIKNNSEAEIFIDDSPRPSTKGTLFTAAFNGLLREKTNKWFRSVNNTERLRVGEIETFEELYNNRVPRAKIEGDFVNISGVGLLSKINYSPFNISMIVGSLEIRYRQNQFSATLYEIPNGGSDSDIDNTYTFEYIFSTR